MAEPSRQIAVDARELLGQPTGVGRYLLEVLREWTRDDAFPHRLSLIVPAEPSPALARELGGRVSWTLVPGLRGTAWEQWQLPRAVRHVGADVLFAAAYTAPIVRASPYVVAIYDVSYFAHPEWFSAREGARRRWLTRAAAARAASIVTISDFSAAEIRHWLKVPPGRIVLAPPGAPQIRPAAPAMGTTVLYVGSLFTRRHIPELIRGFARFAATTPGARLVLVGDNRTTPRIDPARVAAEVGVADRVDWRAYVSDEELDRLYASARVFAFLSDYEGFAMTPLEALARGVPSILLDTPVGREVYGDAAHFVETTPDSIASGLAALSMDSPARDAALAAGRRRLEAFSWRQTADTIRIALERAASA
ncbi:MAG: glycosyltransferase family 1 protein [Acidobacteriota bacterium]